MNQTTQEPTAKRWRIWIDTQRQIVSFHEEEGANLMEFHSEDMFIHCVEQYTGLHYRYQ